MVDTIDTRRMYTMETGYTSSDFSFYRKHLESVDMGRSQIYDLQSRAGKEKWYLVDTYTWRGNFTSETVLILRNDNGMQIETASYGWRRVTTQHEKDLKDKREYEAFVAALAALNPPAGVRRWHSEIIEMFEHTYEDVLYYGVEA